jgi:hypothetical protein
MEVELAELYVTTLGRAPDAEGFDFWLQAVQSGMNVNEIRANWFSSQEEVINRFDGLSNEDFIGLSYLNAFGRGPDDEGLLYWDSLLEDGTLARENFSQALVLGAQAATGNSSDLIALSNRAEVGLLYVKLDGVSDTPATDVVKLVTSDESTVALAESVLALISAARNEDESRDDFRYVNDVIATVFFNTLVDPGKVKEITEYLALTSEKVALNPTPAVSTVFLATAYALADFQNNVVSFGGVENLAQETVYSLWNQGAPGQVDVSPRPPITLPITGSSGGPENPESPPVEISNSYGYIYDYAPHYYVSPGFYNYYNPYAFEVIYYYGAPYAESSHARPYDTGYSYILPPKGF